MLNVALNVNKEITFQHRHLKVLKKDLFLYREVSSTNVIAQSLARSGANEGTIIMSSLQTSGMGRMKRKWECPAGQGILMSMILRPEISLQLVPQLTLLCGVVVAETIQKITGCNAEIKWPNDIVIRGKKVCGILAQSCFSNNELLYVIMGVGININQTQAQLPPDCRETSTSLKLEVGYKVSRLKLLEEFIMLWNEYFTLFLEKGHSFLKLKWKSYNVTLGREVSINNGNEPRYGLAVDISERGGLLVSFPDGTSEEFLAEDLSLGRAHYDNTLGNNIN